MGTKICILMQIDGKVIENLLVSEYGVGEKTLKTQI
jgi:hypothetical protein